MEYQQKYRKQSGNRNAVANKREESSGQGQFEKHIRMDARDFSPIALQRKSICNKVMQRKVQKTDSKIQLVEDKGKKELIAEVDKERSTYIAFNMKKLNYIKSKDVKKLAEKNSGLITSTDFLELTLKKKNTMDEKAAATSMATPDASLKFWEDCVHNYNWCLNFMHEVLECWNGADAEKKSLLTSSLFTQYTLLRQYCGENCRGALEFLLVRNGGNDEQKRICLNDIGRRRFEMIQELRFCNGICAERGMQHSADSKDVLLSGLKGNDCGNFASLAENAGLGKKNYYLKREGNYAEITQYSYHVWLSLTKRNSTLTRGEATAETCAGQGGLFRTVFNIRPDINKRADIDTEINEDREATDGAAIKVHDIIYDEDMRKYNEGVLEDYVKSGKKTYSSENLKELNANISRAKAHKKAIW